MSRNAIAQKTWATGKNPKESIIKKIKSNHQLFKLIGRREGYSLPAMYFEFLITYILCWNFPKEFLLNEQYKNSLFDKFKCNCMATWYFIDHKYNKKAKEDDEISLNTKNLFTKKYHNYIGRETIYAPEATEDEVLLFIKKHNTVICKPIKSFGGHGIFIINYEDVVNNKNIIKEMRECGYQLEEVIAQHPEMASINPSSINTIRLITAIDKTGGVHVVTAMLRAGRPGAIVDNSSSGGVEYALDEETGKVVSCGIDSTTYVRCINHPGSNKLMYGFQVPNYEKAVDLVKNAALISPSIRWVGWDVAIRENDAILIEGNSNFPQGSYMEKDLKKLKKYI